MLIETDADPYELVPVIVYCVGCNDDVGVPEISPVEVLNFRPFENAGEIENDLAIIPS